MFTENGLMVDLGRVQKAVADCDVFTIGFMAFLERLIIDTRHLGEENGPMISLVEPVQTVEERFFWLGQQRPQFGPPEKFTFFIWPHSIAFLESQGITEEIRRRCLVEIWPDVDRQIDDALSKLRNLERRAVQDAVSGQSYHTIWPAGE